MKIDEDDDLGMCQCGSAWFGLVAPDDAEAGISPAVCIDSGGGITGYAGELHCIECGEPWNPNLQFRHAKRHLRVVASV